MNQAGRISLSILQVLLIGILVAFPGGHTLRAVDRPLVASLSSQNSKQYLQVLKSCEQQVAKLYPEAKFIRYSMRKESVENSQVLQEIMQSNPVVLLTIGSRATRAGLNSIPDVPVVASMILNEQVIEQSNRATGVLLSFPPEVHLQWLRRFLPNINRAVMLYNPEENSQSIAGMKETAEGLDFEIETIPVTSVKQLPAALKSLGRKADMLLGMPDNTVYSGKTAKAVLLSTYRNRIPFAGLSPSWVKAGALYSLSWDYNDLGRQCGVLAGKILAGTPAADIAPVTPAKVCYEVNLKTADHMRLTIDPTLVQGATKVYR